MTTDADVVIEPNNTPYVIGVDIGGSAIKLGRFGADGSCHQAVSVATPQPSTPEAVFGVMAEAIATLDPENRTLAIGVGTPGPVDPTGTIAKVAINLANWHDVPLGNWLSEKTGKPVILANDGNCAGLGEAWLGAGRQFRNLLILTLGTGVGGAIILDGKLFTGYTGTAGELGLITLNLYGPECHSGNQGSLEQHLSVQAIQRATRTTPDELGHAAKAGNRQALEFWETYGHQLGAGLASLIYVFGPEAIVLGGGISASAEFFLSATRAEIERRVLPICRGDLQLVVAELGNRAGIVGAAKLAWQRVEVK